MCYLVPICIGIPISIGIGLSLLLYGRNRFLRAIGVLLSSTPGPGIAWLAGKFLLFTVREQLIGRKPSLENTYLLGKDITLGDLLWTPLQNAAFVLFIFVVLAVMMLWISSRQRTEGYPAQDLIFDLGIGRLLNVRRESARLGWLAYRVVIVMSVIFALPVMGLIAYAMLQILMLGGLTFPIEDWINWSVLAAALLFTCLYLFVNGAVAMQE